MINIFFEKAKGTCCYAPYLNITISCSNNGRATEKTFKARLDTGADVSCIPIVFAKSLMPVLLGKPLLSRGYKGKVERTKTHLIRIHIHNNGKIVKTATPPRGVFLTDSDVGLIGMDILNDFHLTINPITQTAILVAVDPIMQAASLTELEPEEEKQEQKALTPLRRYGIILWKHLTAFAGSTLVKKASSGR